jgi:hypothetical protein
MTGTATSFEEYLANLIAKRTYLKIQYFAEFHDLVTTDVIIRAIKNEDIGTKLLLSSGDEIWLNLLISVGGVFAPGYEDYELYCQTCDH